MSPVLSVVLAVAGVAAGVQSARAAGAAAEAQAAATATERRKESERVSFERRRAIRQTLMERQLAVNTAAVSGLEGGSAARGGISSLGSQLGTNLGFGTAQSGLSNLYFTQTMQAQRLSGQSQMFGALSGAFFQGASSFAGMKNLPTVASVPNKSFFTDPYANAGLPIIGPRP